MATIVDKRQSSRNPEIGNRKRFLDRCKKHLKDVIEKELDKTSIDRVGKRDIHINDDGTTTSEPSFQNDSTTGKPRHVLGNNGRHHKGDQIPLPSRQRARGQAKQASDQLGSFSYVLSKKEFLEILFEEMELPDYIKESLSTDVKYRLKRGGVAPDGPITRVNILKTMMAALSRKFATKAALAESDPPRKPSFLTEEDLRFNIYTKRPLHIKEAVMFCIMDVSGSMGDHEKKLAKRFFILLYLFLEQEYDHVKIVFIAHHSEALEMEEEEFFNCAESGGTVVSSAFELMLKIIHSRYDATRTNFYVAQVSDGDNFPSDDETLVEMLTEKVLPIVQYFAYMQVQDESQLKLLAEWFKMKGTKINQEVGGVYALYKENLLGAYKNVGIGVAATMDAIFPVLKKLFKKGKDE